MRTKLERAIELAKLLEVHGLAWKIVDPATIEFQKNANKLLRVRRDLEFQFDLAESVAEDFMEKYMNGDEIARNLESGN